MADFQVIPAKKHYLEQWDSFVQSANGGTMFHERRFLSYHADRFADSECPLVFLKGDSLVGVMPMAVVDEEGRRVARSPYGASYGGPIFAEPLNCTTSQAFARALVNYLRQAEIDELTMRFPIRACYEKPCDTFPLVLTTEGFELLPRDEVELVMDLRVESVWDAMKSRGRRNIRRGQREEFRYVPDAPLEDFAVVLQSTYEKFSTGPTHSPSDLHKLKKMYPDRIWFPCLYDKDQCIAGLGMFAYTSKCFATFYVCSESEYLSRCPIPVLFWTEMERKIGIADWITFGTCLLHRQGGERIFTYKEAYGARGEFREVYRWLRT